MMMNILFCGDANIKDGVVICALSMLKVTNSPLHIYILTAGIETEFASCQALDPDFGNQLQALMQTHDPCHRVTQIDISESFARDLPWANLQTRFTPGCMLRLYADQVEELPDKILYLDNDVVCCRDFTDFYNTDISHAELCGTLDHYGKWFFRSNPFYMDYINSGVLLLNLKEIRRTRLFARCIRRCAEKKMFMPDQSAINKLADRKIIAPRRCNEQYKQKKDTIFRHFSTTFRFVPLLHTVSVKPWQIEKMHRTLGIYEFDDILHQYDRLKKENALCLNA